jgi:hypothetical protein
MQREKLSSGRTPISSTETLIGMRPDDALLPRIVFLKGNNNISFSQI